MVLPQVSGYLFIGSALTLTEEEEEHLREEHLDGSANAKNTEDDEQSPRDVGETWRDEKTQREVEQPVTNSRDTLWRCQSSSWSVEER